MINHLRVLILQIVLVVLPSPPLLHFTVQALFTAHIRCLTVTMIQLPHLWEEKDSKWYTYFVCCIL